jgi:uncharacterized protein YjbI with pentapeptide repeats
VKTFSAKAILEILRKNKLYAEGKEGGERADLSDADLSYADLSYADLGYANLSDANLSYANLSDANLSYANLRRANLGYADLSDASLGDANLSDADLSGANLRRANLRRANLGYANLSDADLGYANLSDADLSCAKGVLATNTSTWSIYATLAGVKIGCQWHCYDAWMAFSDDAILKMHSEAPDFWKIYKPVVMAFQAALLEKKESDSEKI